MLNQLQQSFKSVWVSNSGAVALGVTEDKLAPEQIGVFPADEYCGDGVVTSLTTPTFKTNKRLIIKQGIHPFIGQVNTFLSRQDSRPRETIEFEASDVVGWSGLKSDPVSYSEKVAIGYDGLDASRSLPGKLDAKPLHVNLRLSGEPIKRFFHRNFVEHRFVIDKGLCVGDCECYDSCGNVYAPNVADKIVELVEKQDLFVVGTNGTMYRTPLRQFIKANKIVKCANDVVITPPVLTEYKKISIVVPDDGYSTIADLAVANPTLKIQRESRTGIYTTYSAWVPVATALPSDFTITNHIQPLCDTCTACNDTYTKVNGAKVLQVKKAYGATVPAITGQISRTKISSSIDNGDIYIIVVPTATSGTTIATDLGAAVEYSEVANYSAICVGSSKTFTWFECGSCFKTTKKYMLTLPDTNCDKGESRLTELQGAYSNLTVADLAEGSCIHSYETTVTSDNCLTEAECDTEIGTFNFTAPASYEGFFWEDYKEPVTDVTCDVPAAETLPCCIAGVIFETASWDTTTDECTFGWSNWHPNTKKPVRLQVNIHSLDYSNNPCDETTAYSTILQKLKLAVGTSGEYVQELERRNLIYEGKTWVPNPFVNSVNGFHITAKAHLYYDQYVLRLKTKQFGDTYLLPGQNVIDYVFYFPAGEGKDFETMINSLVLNAGNPELKAVYL